MGAAAGSGASAASIASLGLTAFGQIEKGMGTKASDEFQASRAERAAEFGKLKAGQTDVEYRENLNTTLANIDVTRAAAHTDPTSPTGVAVSEHERMLSDRARTTALLGINSQIAEDEASAKYLREAGDYALKMGYLGAGISVAGGLAKGATA